MRRENWRADRKPAPARRQGNCLSSRIVQDLLWGLEPGERVLGSPTVQEPWGGIHQGQDAAEDTALDDVPGRIENQHSTRFIKVALVGVKWRWKHSWSESQARTSGRL